MKAKHLRPYVGAPVIVQFRDAMAIGDATGAMQPAIHVNKDGKPLLRDGKIADKGTDPNELGFVESWPIDVRKDSQGGAEFRFAIAGSIRMYDDDEEICDIVYEPTKGVLVGLVVDITNIVGITLVKVGTKPTSLITPGTA